MLRRGRHTRRQRDLPHTRYTGPDAQTRLTVQNRFAGRCARCGQVGWTVHHRKPRGMGGSRDPAINSAANLLWLCGDGVRGCHGWIESNRNTARANGWLVPYAQDAATIPVLLWDGRRVLLDHDGTYKAAE